MIIDRLRSSSSIRYIIILMLDDAYLAYDTAKTVYNDIPI